MKELYDKALKRVISLYPVADSRFTCENPQLMARDFWVKLDHSELGAEINYPGAFAMFSETPLRIQRRPPLIGEHNKEIYIDELGLSNEELVRLQRNRAI